MLYSLRNGYTALVVGSSGGIGSNLLTLLKEDPQCARAIGLSRNSDPKIDYDDPTSFGVAAKAIRDEVDELDVILIATGALTAPSGDGPEKAFRDLKESNLTAVFQVNTIGPALVLSHFLSILPRARRCLVATLSARVGSIGDNSLGGWISYRASKAALNQITHTAAIELGRKNRESVCVALHPGTIPTDLSRAYARDRFTHEPEDCASSLLTVLNQLTPEQSGGFYDYSGARIVW